MNKRNNNYSLRIAWLYPDLMSTYGDRGNMITLQKRAQWRGIDVEILSLSLDFPDLQLTKSDLILMGGAEDRQQEIVSKDLQKGKGQLLQQRIEENIPGLFVCGAYQFLGSHYKEADGSIIPGLGIFDVYTEHPGLNHARLVGNTVVKNAIANQEAPLVGFENHGGRTYLGKNVRAFGTVLKGFGNNGTDKTEGAVYKNAFGTYLHGPLLPKNPSFADYLLQTALEVKYKEPISLEPLDDTLEEQARDILLKKLNIAMR